jgi:hypothetical protein
MSSDSDLPADDTAANDAKGKKARARAPRAERPKGVAGERPPESVRLNVLVFSLLSFCLIAFGLWLVSAGKTYREEYAEATEGWRVGSTRPVELTLVKDDKRKLGCASDQTVAGLHCAYRRSGREATPSVTEGPQILQPYNTVGNELLLGAGLWRAPDFDKGLPEQRFTAVCNFNIKGLMKSAAIRFDLNHSFSPLGKVATIGTLTDCVVSR